MVWDDFSYQPGQAPPAPGETGYGARPPSPVPAQPSFGGPPGQPSFGGPLGQPSFGEPPPRQRGPNVLVLIGIGIGLGVLLGIAAILLFAR